jgi:hypothetical protein
MAAGDHDRARIAPRVSTPLLDEKRVAFGEKERYTINRVHSCPIAEQVLFHVRCAM